MRRFTWCTLFLAVATLSCSSPNEADLPLSAPGVSTPVATGINITSYAGELLAVWGTPADGPAGRNPSTLDLPVGYAFDCPYPNPSQGSITLQIAMTRTCVVSIWVVHARWKNDPNDDFHSILGATANAPQTVAVKELMREKTLGAGRYAVLWDAKDNGGIPVPSGFYRIYVRFETCTAWRDLFIYTGTGVVPAGLHLPNDNN